MSRVLVTGADGFVGPYLVQHLQESGDDVVTAGGASGPDLRSSSGWMDFMADQRPECVYHLAGWSNVGKSWDSPLDCFSLNANGTATVLEAARKNSVAKILLISSADVYSLDTPVPITEHSPISPSTPYAASKLAAELVAQQYNIGYGLEVAISRSFNHIGPTQSGGFVVARFAKRVAEIELDPSQFLTHGNLGAIRDFCDVRDVVRGYRLIMEADSAGEIYNVCTGHGVSIGELLNKLIELSGVEVTTKEDPALMRKADCPVRIGSADKLHEQTNWEPTHDLNETLAEILNHQRALVK